MPPLFMMLPPREKNGRASSEKESRPEKQRWAAIRAKMSAGMLNRAVMTEAMPMPAEMGTPASSRTKKEPKRLRVACTTISCCLLSSQRTAGHT